VPLIGILGAAISTLISVLILSFLMYYFAVNIVKFELGLKFILKSVLASFIMSFLILEYNPMGMITVLISIGFAIGVYFGLLILLRGISIEELKFFKSLFKIG
jgi:O-antigen/teichoic acid export membrane protein